MATDQPPRPFVSEAQRAKWQQLVVEGKITPGQFAAREQATVGKIPDRAPVRPRTTGASRGFDKAQFGQGKGFTVDDGD